MSIEPLLQETFTATTVNPALRWHCEPARWSVQSAVPCLRIEPDAKTDFWRKTHYDFELDNGHVLAADVRGDFVLATHVRFRPAHQYDQAGLMVRVSPTCWLKTSVEHEPVGSSRLGAVVTNGYSDWSTQAFPSGAGEIWLRIRREGQDYVVEASRDGTSWEQIRLARLHDDVPGAPVAAGLYACSPRRAGFVAEFSYLTIDRGRLDDRA